MLHKCDNPPCSNPEHLYVGTMKDNMRDCVSRGRLGPRPDIRGTKNPKAKITDAQAVEVRTIFMSEGKEAKGLRVLEKKLGITRKQIIRIAQGKCWPHLACVAYDGADQQKEGK